MEGDSHVAQQGQAHSSQHPGVGVGWARAHQQTRRHVHDASRTLQAVVDGHNFLLRQQLESNIVYTTPSAEGFVTT